MFNISNLNRHCRTMLTISLLAGLIAGTLITARLVAEAARHNDNALVMFTASWCAKCRPVQPITQEVASQNGLGFSSIDVDVQNAPAEASNFGLSIPSADLPQVYLVKNGHTSLVLDGRTISYGKDEQIRLSLLGNIQQALAH